MEQSFSWTRSALRYKGIYDRALTDTPAGAKSA
jgi:hypothetical protein